MRVLHMFQYPIRDIIPKLKKVKEQGFTHIQISSMQGTKEDSNIWWLLYQPINIKIGNIQIGNKEDLINLCKEAESIGLKIIVDVILRHIATDNYDNTKPHHRVDKNLLKYIKATTYINDWNNRYEVINYSTGMPVLDYNNKELQNIYIEYLDDLKSCGVSGFRLDQCKHFALPCEKSSFFNSVIKRYDDFGYGECIYCEKETLDKYTKFLKVATDGWASNKDSMICWVESHDTFLNDGDIGYTKFMSEDLITNEYINLCINYNNTLFYARPFSSLWMDERIRFANLNKKY